MTEHFSSHRKWVRRLALSALLLATPCAAQENEHDVRREQRPEGELSTSPTEATPQPEANPDTPPRTDPEAIEADEPSAEATNVEDTNVEDTSAEASAAEAAESDTDEAHVEASNADELDKSGTPPLPPREGEVEPPQRWEEDYDGRKKETRAEDILIWVPRAPLYPVHLVLDYGVRWPIVSTLTLAEEHNVFKRIEDFFTFADGRAGIFPIAFYDTRRGFWGGLNFFFNDWGVEGHSFKATAGFGTNNWIQVSAKDSWQVFEDNRGEITFGVNFSHNPTFAYTGIGPDTSIDDEVYFGEQKVEGTIDVEIELENLSRFTTGIDFRQARLSNGRDPGINSAESPFDTFGYTGFDEKFFIGGVDMLLAMDSRQPRTAFIPGSGVRLETWGNYNYGFGDNTSLSFFGYGVSPMVFWDITGANHVLLARVFATAQSRTGGDEIPLNELVSLGGTEHMRAFAPGRFRGESALVYSLDYSWPLLSVADALIFAEMGNVFEGFYDEFDHDKMAIDWGTGLRTSFSRDLQLLLAVGFGSNQINQWQSGFDVDNVRFFVGAGRAL